MRIKRFTLAQRLFHMLLLICFLVLAASGVSRMYIETQFGGSLASLFGGFEGALAAHKLFGILLLVLFVLHILYLMVAVRSRLFGRDSLLPRTRDLRDLLHHLGWMLGLRRHPSFERWGYWEKFDYWAVFWGLFVIGGTGLMLFDPVATSRLFPGWSMNVAFWIHRIEAILAMAHVFFIHFLIAHLRRTTFPMDRAMIAGTADLEIVLHERADWINRLKDEGRLEEVTTQDTGRGSRMAAYAFGVVAMGLGFYLLIGGIVNARFVTW
jgi:cytochrome b subunit of formate dehydrogenase